MKAVVVEQFGSIEHMKYVDVELPPIHSTQVLIRVRRTCVNFADIKARHGNKGQGKLPFIPGLEAAGVVEQVGDEVRSVRVGQRVIAFPHNGSYAQFIVADEHLTFAVPDHIEDDTAGACGIVSLLSYKLLAEVARMEAGVSKIEVAKRAGANIVFNYETEHFIEQIKEFTAGRGVDIILDFSTVRTREAGNKHRQPLFSA